MSAEPIDPALERELSAFVAAEAALLDAARYDEWLALYTDDGRYWVPLQGARQADPHSHNSLAYEDPLLLALRIERLKNPRAHSQHPPSRCQHVLQRSAVEPTSTADRAETRTPFLYVESRGDETLTLAGSAQHSLVRANGTWKIRLKRVDLLDAERALPAIQLFI
ncbi:MAG: aromatic-ring-hydroxylating dioxygenase subunit beta [Caldimonas sp.]